LFGVTPALALAAETAAPASARPHRYRDGAPPGDGV